MVVQRLRAARIPASRVLALVLGVGYLVLGIAGFLAANGTLIGRDSTNTVWVFSVGLLLNLGYLLIGVLALLSTRSLSWSQLFGWASMVVFIALLAYGIPAALIGGGDQANINWADIGLYAVSAVVGLVMGVFPVRRRQIGIESAMADRVARDRDNASSRHQRK